MERRPVSSSNLAAVGYDKSRKILEIEFRTGAIYQYQAVHANTARGLLAAPSKGKYVWKNIRGKYSFSKAG